MKTSTKPIYILLWMLLLPAGLQAQFSNSVKANPDNAFAIPIPSFDKFATSTFDVLSNDDPGDCTLGALKLTIVRAPAHALSCMVNNNNQILYIPVIGYTGYDELTYQIECSGTIDTTKLHIHVNNLPDNITPNVCHIPPPPQVWGIAAQKTTEHNLSPYVSAMVGDIDNDGIVEILVCADPSNAVIDGIYRPSSKIAVYKGNDLSVAPKIITTVKPYSWNYETRFGIVKTKVSGVDSTLVVVMESDKYMRAYNSDGGLVWTSDNVYHSASIAHEIASPIFTDLNRDGIPEIVAAHKVFNSTNGKLLCAAPHQPSNYFTPFVVDLYNTGTLNVIIGPRIYEPTDASLTGLTLVKTITASIDPTDLDWQNTSLPFPATPYLEHVSAVDMDNDGKLDLVYQTYRAGLAEPYVGESFIFIVDPDTGAVKASKYIPYAPMCSYPFVGDIDGDGFPEIVFITSRRNLVPSDAGYAAEASYRKMHAYKYVPGNPLLQKFWELPHSDGSGFTVMTLFDFNQDGISEIVYRDETDIRIINGSLKSHLPPFLPVAAPYNLASYPNMSGTSAEYPVVADVDGDGQAEIVIVGGEQGVDNARSIRGPLWVYKSADPINSPWAPARKVWNQYGYNPVFINEDLTVPVYPISPATAFYEADGITVNRPYNNFLQQATALNDEGDMLYLAPDLEFTPGRRPRMLHNETQNRLEITVSVHNNVLNHAGAPFVGPLKISTYVYESNTPPTPGGFYFLMNTHMEPGNIAVDGTKEITYYINNYSSLSFPPNYDKWVIVLNGTDAYPGTTPTYYHGSKECNSWNNIADNITFSTAERVLCEGETEVITLAPSNVYNYRWYTTADGLTPIRTNSDTCTVTKNSDLVQYYFVDIYTKSAGIKLNTVRDTVFVWLAPDSLVWTGGANTADWHNHKNWKNPNDSTGKYSRANIPRKCTDVLIPDMLSIYPDLNSPQTDYSYYHRPSACADIWFEHGGEVMQNNLLEYDRAYVYLTLNTDRWNLITVPLQGQFPGDYYLTDPNPLKDSLFVYTRLFNQTNPETGYIAADWTGVFNNPEIPMPAGAGLSAWLWDKHFDAHILKPDTFLFPKHDTYYNIYSELGSIIDTRPIPRVDEHRFIYEPEINAFGEFPLHVSADNAYQMVLVGNPFMSHLDFNAFFQLNGPSGGDWIKNRFYVVDETGNYISYNASTGQSTGMPGLSPYIAPLQSFLVETGDSFSQLYANVDMMRSIPGEKLRSAASEDVSKPVLTMELTDLSTGQKNRALLLLNPESSQAYDDHDVPKIMPVMMKNGAAQPIPASIFSRSSDGTALDMNQIPAIEEGLLIPIGIRSGKAGMYRISISTLSGFDSEYHFYLVDSKSDGSSSTEHDLRFDFIIDFEKPTPEEILDNRFYLSFKRNTTGIVAAPVVSSPGIEAYTSGNMLHVFTTDGSSLEEVQLYDLQGRMISQAKGVGRELIIPVSTEQIYIIRARSENTSRSIKVYGRRIL